MTSHGAGAPRRTTGRPWLRSAGWLILVPPVFVIEHLGLVLDRRADLKSIRNFVEATFGFWRSGLPIEYRVRPLVNLLLFLGAIAVGLVTVVGGVGRIAALLVAAAQALVCPVGIIWDHGGYRSFPPEAIRRLPAPPGGRFTSAFYLLLAIAAFVLALVDRTPRVHSPAGPQAPPQWSPPTSSEPSPPASAAWSSPAAQR